jgi:hypothetical protein
MPLYGSGNDITTRLPRRPNLPTPPVAGAEDRRTLEAVLSYLDALDRAIVSVYDVLSERVQRYVVLSESVAFAAGDTTAAVTFTGPLDDTSYQIALSATWDTRLRWSSKATTGFTITASGSPGGSGGTVDYVISR